MTGTVDSQRIQILYNTGEEPYRQGRDEEHGRLDLSWPLTSLSTDAGCRMQRLWRRGGKSSVSKFVSVRKMDGISRERTAR